MLKVMSLIVLGLGLGFCFGGCVGVTIPAELIVKSREVTLADNVKLALAYCPPCTDTKGSPGVSAEFWLGKTEVTQAQWRAVMGNNPSDPKGDDLPVVNVSWDDAVAFCKKLTEKNQGSLPNGYEYRLPSEEESDYACLGGSSRKSHRNNTKQYNKILPVAKKSPNGWGLYDMHGNVDEWCLNRGSYRIGCFFAGGAPFRISENPPIGRGDRGFRIALAPAGRK